MSIVLRLPEDEERVHWAASVDQTGGIGLFTKAAREMLREMQSSPMAEHDSSFGRIGQQAAGFWEDGSPPRPGRYLCVYEGLGQRQVAVLAYVFDERREDFCWETGALDVEVLSWAEVNA